MTLKNNRASLLCYFKLGAKFHRPRWIQTGVTVRKRSSGVLTSVTLTFDLWPWAFAWTSLLSLVITPENLMMIRWWEHSEKCVTDRQTDERTDWTICIAAWLQLKRCVVAFSCYVVNVHVEKWFMRCDTKRAIWWDLYNKHTYIFCIKHMSTIFRTLQVNKW